MDYQCKIINRSKEIVAHLKNVELLVDYINQKIYTHPIKDSKELNQVLVAILEENGCISHKKLKNILSEKIGHIFTKKAFSAIYAEYWKIRGYPHDESMLRVSETQQNRVRKKTQECYDKLKYTSKLSRQYWLNLGHSEEECSNILKDIQGRGKKFLKEKGHSEDEIKAIMDDRNTRWQKSMTIAIEKDPTINSRKGKSFKELIELHGKNRAIEIIKKKTNNKGYSKNSQNCFELIINNLGINREECLYGDDEFFLNSGNNFYRFDFKYRNLIIEFDGDFWHMNPSIYAPNDINRVTNRLAKDIWEYDKKKMEHANSKGYIYHRVWESDWKSDIEGEIKIIKNLIKNV